MDQSTSSDGQVHSESPEQPPAAAVGSRQAVRPDEPLTVNLLAELLANQTKQFQKTVTGIESKLEARISNLEKKNKNEFSVLQAQREEDKKELKKYCDTAVKAAIAATRSQQPRQQSFRPLTSQSSALAPPTASTSGLVFGEEYDICRRTVLLFGIDYVQAETPESLASAARSFFLDNMEADPTRIEEFGPFSASRPITKHRDRSKAPVEVTCSRQGERDYLMSCMTPLSRAEPRWSLGRIVAKYPESWNNSFKRLSKQAAKLREVKVEHPQNPGEQIQAMYTQVRYSDDEDGLTIFAKVLIDDAPWLPLKSAEEMFPQVFANLSK